MEKYGENYNMKQDEFDLDRYISIIEWMKLCHGNQFRAFSKVPYWTHPIRVACLVMKFKKSHKLDDLIIAALLHDLVEDTDTRLEIINYIYGNLVGSLVDELTSDKEEIKEKGKILYLANKMINMSSWALIIKLCDRLDNIIDLIYTPDSFVKKYGKETFLILESVRKSRNLSPTHNKIIEQIDKTLDLYYKFEEDKDENQY